MQGGLVLYAVTILTFSNCSGVKVFCAGAARDGENPSRQFHRTACV